MEQENFQCSGSKNGVMRRSLVLFLALIIIIVVVFSVILLNKKDNNLDTTNNSQIKINDYNGKLPNGTLDDADKTNWNEFLNQKIAPLIQVKYTDVNSSITYEDMAEMICEWAQLYDYKNYIKNATIDNNKTNTVYVNLDYLTKAVNSNFDVNVTADSYKTMSTNSGYYIHKFRQVEVIVPKVESVVHNSKVDTYTIKFVTLKSSEEYSFDPDILKYDKSQIDKTYEVTVMKESNNIKILTLKKM
ncbi:MAG: hypothetical protein N2749_00400 [Clostridia bacterium]|nr:hypothetical protein [Clostridia bacterium]